MKIKLLFSLLIMILSFGLVFSTPCEDYLYEGDRYLINYQYKEAAANYLAALNLMKTKECLIDEDFYYFLNRLGIDVDEISTKKRAKAILANALEEYTQSHPKYIENLKYELNS